VSAHRLKWFRVAVALVVSGGLTAAFVDFRGWISPAVGNGLASVQLVPSLVALATGAALALGGVVILALTVLAGRVYCSALCPLGILQDALARIARWLRRGRQPPLRYARPLTLLRQAVFWVTVAGLVAGAWGLTLSLVDPYSNFGRMASDVFRPLLVLGNNLLAGPAHAIGFTGLYRVDLPWAVPGALHQPAVLLALLIVLVVLRGRLYCNTLCPVGTLLGWLAQRAAFRLAIDQAACTKCGDCLGACRAQCIDLRGQAIDASRCVACYNCLGACAQHGIAYRLAWRRKATAPARPAGAPPVDAAIADPERRAFLAGAAVAVTASLGVPVLLARAGGPPPGGAAAEGNPGRSEERRVGKEC
jgi:polyferredoxin